MSPSLSGKRLTVGPQFVQIWFDKESQRENWHAMQCNAMESSGGCLSAFFSLFAGQKMYFAVQGGREGFKAHSLNNLKLRVVLSHVVKPCCFAPNPKYVCGWADTTVAHD